MLKKKFVKLILVLSCIMTLIMPYASTVLAVALTQQDTSAELQVLRVHKGGEEASGTLTENQQPYYDETPYGYRVGDTRVFKIITKGDVNYENAFYCLNAEKSFPGVTGTDYKTEAYTNVADLTDSTDANVKALHLSTSNSVNSDLWNNNYKSLIWLINNIYLPSQAPKEKDSYLAKAFAGTGEDLELVKALLTDDDIDVVQQYAIWYFTNGDATEANGNLKYINKTQDGVLTYPAVTLTRYDVDITQTEDGVVQETIERSGSYGDFTPADFPENLSYSLRQDFANILYKYLVSAATTAAAQEAVTYPVIVEDVERTSTLKDNYYVVGPFKVNSGTAATTDYSLKLLNQADEEISKNDYQIIIEGEQEFTNKNINEIFDKNYYIYLPISNTDITTIKLKLDYSSYETQASLWKNTKTNEEGIEIYQPLTLITRGETPHSQKVEINIDRRTADLALRKYIIKVNDNNINRKPTEDVSKLKDGTSKTAIYKHTKQPVEVSVGDTIVYEIRVYNEADISGKANIIYDALPIGLEFVENSEINRTYGWTKAADGDNRVVYKTETLKDTEIEAFDKTADTETEFRAKSAYVQIECKVSNSATAATILTNVAELGEDSFDDRDSTPTNNSYVTQDLNSTNYKGHNENIDPKNSTTNDYFKGIEDDDDFEKIIVEGKSFDLSLQKFITKINKNAPEQSREPKVDVSKLKNETSTDGTYTTVKTPITVKKGDIVTYTLRIYNEGEIAGYAEEVSDYLPEGLGFLVNHTTNVDNYWAIPQECKTVKLSTIENGTANLSVDDFTGITNLSDVEVVVGKAKLTSTKLKSTVANDKNLIKAFDKENGTTLDYKDIQITCIVLADKSENNNLKNIAEILKHSDENKLTVTDRDSIPGTVNQDDYPGNDEKQDDHDYENLVTEEPKVFDLSLQKFITGVNNTSITDRVPTITKNTDGTLRFNHNSNALPVCYNDLVTFTIRVYNEGDLAGYAKEVIDYLPTEGLEFVTDNEINKKYDWKLYDTNGNETNKVDQAVSVRTDYLSKEKSEKRNDDCLIKAFDNSKDISSTNPDYKDLQIVFKVVGKVTNETKDSVSKREYINTAEIYDDQDENGNSIDDKDSIPNNKKNGEDDIDSDKVYVKYFDLKLKKDLVKIIITEDGKTREINVSSTDGLQKVEIHRKKINSTVVKFVYNITITNEGEIAGYATEIKDYIPEGLEFISEENKQWTKVSENVITTNALANTLLEPGKSASVQVTLKWKNAEDNFGLKTNVAEISGHKNDSDTPDIDSTPDNKKDGEDDIDKAEVYLGISTGIATPKYMALTGTVIAIWVVGIILIKKYVLY